MDARVRVGLSSALLTIVLFSIAAAPYTSSANTQHGCAPQIPPPVAGTLVPAPATPGSVLINEILPVPGSTWNCSETNKTFSLNSDSWVYTKERNIALIAQVLEFPLLYQRLRCTR